jgi:hypothetical protein
MRLSDLKRDLIWRFRSGWNPIMRDFLAFHGYASNREFRLVIEEIRKKGYSVDRVDETTVRSFPYAAGYKFILLCWHDALMHWSWIERVVRRYPDAVLVQYDDTDWSDHIMGAGNLRPRRVFKREANARLKSKLPCHPFPKTAPDLFEQKTRDIPVSCIMSPTNPRRADLMRHLESLRGQGWVLSLDPVPHAQYVDILNRSKIAISFHGNGYDTIRFWEILSSGAALLTPRIPLLIPALDEAGLVYYKEDFSDLGTLIRQLLDNDCWQAVGERGRQSYLVNHTPEIRARHLLEILESDS